jgi:hypothetical protein
MKEGAEKLLDKYIPVTANKNEQALLVSEPQKPLP